MVLEELHDECAALVQGAAQRRVRHLLILQLTQHIVRLRACAAPARVSPTLRPCSTHTQPSPTSPVFSKVKMSPSHLALLGVLGSELQLERRRIFRLGEMGSSVDESRSGGQQ